MCGEKRKPDQTIHPWMGSPPRVRGKGTGKMRLVIRRGITPACAGKRAFYGCFFFASQDHPRVCGEKLSVLRMNMIFLGSPPRVRGKA